jgi:hypothetical protein
MKFSTCFGVSDLAGLCLSVSLYRPLAAGSDLHIKLFYYMFKAFMYDKLKNVKRYR